MDSFLNRYRSISFLLLMIVAQLLLIAYQVRSQGDVRLIRVWAVTAVTPLARALEATRSGIAGFFGDYLSLRDIRGDYRRLKEEVGRLKLENQFLRSELATAERAQALAAFQARTPSRTVAARVTGIGPGANSKVVFVDVGSGSGVQKGMAVVTPNGIVGKVSAVFPLASQVQLITDPGFAAGVMSQKNRVRGTLKGQGTANCKVDFVENEDDVPAGDWFFTSGDDRVFPKGLPVGQVKTSSEGPVFRQIGVDPSGFQNGLEEVLVVLEGVHGQIPDAPVTQGPVYVGPPVPSEPAPEESPEVAARSGTDADRLRERYKIVGEAQGHVFGEGLPGSRPPDFNLSPAAAPRPGAEPAKPETGPSESRPAPAPIP